MKNAQISKINHLKKVLSVDDETVSKMMADDPLLLTLKEATVSKKIDFYKDTLNVDQGKISKMIVSHPSLLGHSQDTVVKKR